MSSIKIAIVSPYGAEPRLDKFAEFVLAQNLQRRGHQVRFFTYALKANPFYHDRTTVYKEIKIRRCRQRLGLSISLFLLILTYRPRVVMFFHPRSYLNFTAYLAGRLVGAKIIAEIVGVLHDPYVADDRDNPYETLKSSIRLITSWSKLLSRIFSGRLLDNWKNFIFHMPTAKSDAIVAINKEEQRYIKQFYGRESELIYWSISQPETAEQTKPAPEKYGPYPPDYLLLVAQVKRRKGWDTVIEALSILKKQGLKKNLIFVCPTKDTFEAADFIKKNDVQDLVFFMNQVTNEEKNWLYKNTQYVLAPSRYEGFGLPVFEGFLAGRPVLATAIPVYLEFLEHKKNAMISKTGDGAALAANIRELDNNPALAEDLVKQGYLTAEQFNDQALVNKFSDLINRLLK